MTHSISSQILVLQTEHRQLDIMIRDLEARPHVDRLEIQRFKKQKLKMKELIERLRAELIPDLDA